MTENLTAGAMPVGLMLELSKMVDDDLDAIERVQSLARAWRAVYGKDPDPSVSLDQILQEVLVALAGFMDAAADREPTPDEPSLASLFAVVDSVFTEHDAFYRTNVTIGRIYREWKKVRRALGGDDYVTPEQHDPEVTLVFVPDLNGEILHGVYADARDAGYAVSRLDGARAETVILR
jgi:hypothetical protein